MATTSNRSGSAATTSRVWVPIEPVDPAMETVVRGEPTVQATGGLGAQPPAGGPGVWGRSDADYKKKSASLATK